MKKPTKAFIGFETFQNNLRMILKMQIYILFVVSIVVFSVYFWLFFRVLDVTEKSIVRAYILSNIHNYNDNVYVIIDGRKYKVTYRYVLNNYSSYAQKYIAKGKQNARKAYILYVLVFGVNYLFLLRAKKQSESQYLRGSMLLEADELQEKIDKKEASYLPVGEVKMPVSAEVKHSFIIGRPGVGKTVLLSQILEKIIARGDKVIVHDFKGDYLQKFYRSGKDIIFNPLDARSVHWNIFDEIESPIDIDAIGYALIPDAKGAGMDPFWNNAARDVFTGILNFLYRNNMKTYMDLYNILTSPSTDIAEALLSTPGSEAGATAIGDPEAKSTGSIMSVLTQYTKIFGYMQDKKGDTKKFNLKEWIEDENAGNIYITNYANLQDTLAPILSLMVDLLSRNLLSLSESSERRIFIKLDEFGMLKKLQSIVSILTQARSKGVGVLIGIQDFGQIERIYGKESLQTIINACGTTISFAVADKETAKGLAEKFGEAITVETYVTQSMGVADNRDGLSINQQRHKEQVILSSEITDLPDLHCYVRFPGYPNSKSTLTWKGFEDRNTPFIIRKGLTYSEMLEAAETVDTQVRVQKESIDFGEEDFFDTEVNVDIEVENIDEPEEINIEHERDEEIWNR